MMVYDANKSFVTVDNSVSKKTSKMDVVSEADQKILDSLLRKEAFRAMTVFFKNKRFYCGGKIPEHMLWTEENIDCVKNTDLEIGIEFFYKWVNFAIKINGGLARTQINKLSDSIHFCVNLIHEMEQLGLSKSNYGGLLLLYLYLCEGVTNYFEICT